MRNTIKTVFLLCFVLCPIARAVETDTGTDSEAYWDYGFAIGAIHLEHYPSADQYSNLVFPSPTFQYRGKILRADDRDGAQLYLYKGPVFNLELSGTGYPALDSSNNQARTGMEDLPWLIALGPQLVSRAIENFEFSLGLYQATTTDFQTTRLSGNIFVGRVTYEWKFPFDAHGPLPMREAGHSLGKLSYSLEGGSKEFHSVYFEVPADKATPDRPAYEARDGVLSQSISYYQSFKSGRVSLYAGAIFSSYENSANRASPLHKSNTNISALVGFNYILGESSKSAIPKDETSGLINKRDQ